MGLKTAHFHGQKQGPDDDDFIKFVEESRCLYQVAQKCISSSGVKRHSDYYKQRIKELCIDTSHWKQRSNWIRITIDDETFKTIVNNSTSWSDLYRKCGLHKKSDIYDRVKMMGLDTNHFLSRGRQIKWTEKNIFVVESQCTNSHYIKQHLLRDFDRSYECSKYKNENFTKRDGVLMWKDEEIVLQLEHINGVHNDNRLENLTLLCPNCHSQTSTYAGRNKKKNKNVMQMWVEDGKIEHPSRINIPSLLN